MAKHSLGKASKHKFSPFSKFDSMAKKAKGSKVSADDFTAKPKNALMKKYGAK